MSPKRVFTSEEKKDLVLSTLEDGKAVDPVVIDVHERTPMTNFMVMASGTSRVHIRALADAVIQKFGDNGIKNKKVAGYEDLVWVLLDYGDVIVHVMSPEQREFYRLEAYWSGEEKGSPPPLSPEER